MYRIGSYQYVFRPCYPPGEPRRLDTWSECTADVQSDRRGPDGISREYRRGRSGIPISRRYLRNVARCMVERLSKRPSSYMPKLSIAQPAQCQQKRPVLQLEITTQDAHLRGTHKWETRPALQANGCNTRHRATSQQETALGYRVQMHAASKSIPWCSIKCGINDCG